MEVFKDYSRVDFPTERLLKLRSRCHVLLDAPSAIGEQQFILFIGFAISVSTAHRIGRDPADRISAVGISETTL